MELKEHYLEHKAKTQQSFGLVSLDIAGINSSLQKIYKDIAELRKEAERILSELNIEKNAHSVINNSFAGGIAKSNKLIMEMLPRLKEQSLLSRKIGSRLKKNEEEIVKSKKSHEKLMKIKSNSRETNESIKKIKNLLERKLKRVNRANMELEARLKNHQKRIIELNRKIDNQKIIKAAPSRKIIIRKIPKKVITTEIIPKKIVTRKTIKKTMPKKIVTKKVIPKKVVTKTVTPQSIVTETVTQDKEKTSGQI